MFLAALATGLPAVGQRRGSYAVQVCYDSTAVPELFTTIPIGIVITYPDGTRESTRGFLRGRLRWHDLHVSTPQGMVQEGRLTYDRDKVWNNHHRVSFRVTAGDTTLTADLDLPYVEQIRFNLYTDSLKRSTPFYLNVEGRFSSGRIYPLDTGMVAFEKEGGGLLEGNVIALTPGDSDVCILKVYTWLKADPAMRDSAVVPVKKLPDPSSLPTEQQLLDQWKKRKR